MLTSERRQIAAAHPEKQEQRGRQACLGADRMPLLKLANLVERPSMEAIGCVTDPTDIASRVCPSPQWRRLLDRPSKHCREIFAPIVLRSRLSGLQIA
jgi:hypothetical protein